MAQLMPIIFLGIIYGIWKWLDSMQLPNTISIILVALVIICGGFWAFYKFSADPRRKLAIAQQQKRLGRALTEEEKAEIQPKSAVGEFLPPCLVFYSLLPYCVRFYLSRFKFQAVQWNLPCVWAIFGSE